MTPAPAQNRTERTPHPSAMVWRFLVAGLPMPLVLASLCGLGALVNYLLFHTLAELFSIVIGLVALVVATTSLRFTRNHFVVFIAVAIGWCAGLDLAHTLVFQGMSLLPGGSANPPTQLWIGARAIQAVALIASPMWFNREVRLAWLHTAWGLVVALTIALIATGHFPEAYTEDVGLTPFKIAAEYTIIALLLGTLWRLWGKRELMSPRLLSCLCLAVVFMVLSEFAFTRYVSVSATANLLGHVFKIFAYWYVYLALVQNTLREPFSMLARAASTYDAVPDPTLIVDREGRIRQANQAAALATGQSASQLVGQSHHALFHDARQAPGQCPVCQGLYAGRAAFSTELDRGPATVECSVAPFHSQEDRQAYVEVIRDITERRRLAAEREELVHSLGERIKELRCLHAIAKRIERPDTPLPTLLDGVVALLPSAFLRPAQAHAHLRSAWGDFGEAPPPGHPARLEEAIRVHGHAAGTLAVWYALADVPAQAPAFVPEEADLLGSVAQQIGNTVEKRQAAEKVQRLSNLYEMLSATNRAVVYSPDPPSLLTRMYEALTTHGAFPMVFLALTDTGAAPLRLERSHGIPPEIQPVLARSLAEPGSSFNRLLPGFEAGKITLHALPPPGDPDAWLDCLRSMGVQERAVLPLVCEGRLLGAFGLYAPDASPFDEDELRLLNEMASDLSFALNHLGNQARLDTAQQMARLSEQRFTELFEASPLPMQIVDQATGQIRTLNKALQRWLGYPLQEVATVDAWFERVYPDPAVREALRTLWQEGLALARDGQTVHSPELTLRCKDGHLRTARGTMTLLGNDCIVAWTDLTDIRQSERILRESEQRFRAMIEQTVSGIYVRRDGRFIYANPRYCDMLGWSLDELLGHEVLHFTNSDPDNLARIEAAWRRVEAGERQVTYQVPVRRKDGQTIELELHAKPITWDDDQTATIVVAEDITERKRASAQISSYVKQLESAMRGTLQAVSNMVELRDPYTAGHERRVGLLAGAIAREMGWDAQRCSDLEMVGLVHDIGKIAVPAEILSKPSRLSALEMELVKVHAQAGYEILKDVHFATPVADIIRQHHERMDGSGYPQGLQGAAILPEARILAVADVIESMSAHRPYRPAVGLEAALAEVVQGRGRLYDPEAVDAAIRLVRDQQYHLPR
ncbi:MAG: MASE3 domain-containing protein [Burkholderiaceae bacterium]|nr:MASE3 domain-containing protein [Burkholderiaceae bacterium]